MPDDLDFVTRLKGCAPRSGITPAEAREEFSRLYIQYQKRNLPRMEKVSVGDDLLGYFVRPPLSSDKKILLFFHGGGFTVGSTRDHLGLIAGLARAAETTVFSVDYRLAPEHLFPAALFDSVAGYRFLIDEGYDPGRIIPAGISAGGTLALGLILYTRNEGHPIPGGVIAMSPAVDMLFPGDSVARNRDLDWIPSERLHAIRDVYLAGSDPCNPLASPIYADLSGFPPLLVQAGTHEVLFDDISRFVEKAAFEGVPVTFEKYPAMFHCWQIFGTVLHSAEKAISSAGNFVKQIVG
jgi:monoterpene epsilon-lactone hydrolase